MTYFRKSITFRYLNNCKLQIVPDCQRIFTDTIRQGRTKAGKMYIMRQKPKKGNYACKRCMTRLYLLNLTIKRYNIMEENKIDETMDWKSPTSGVMTIVSEVPLKSPDGKEVIGTSARKQVVKTTKEELIGGLNILRERLITQKKKSEDIVAKMRSIGKKPVVTSAQVRLKLDLQQLGAYTEYNKLEAQKKALESEINLAVTTLDKREAVLAQAPKE